MHLHNTVELQSRKQIFAGLWLGSVKPDMTLILKPMTDEITKLSNNGNLICTSKPFKVIL